MESSSSSEMKKKRGKAQRLVSRYSDRDFWHTSSCSASVWRVVSLGGPRGRKGAGHPPQGKMLQLQGRTSQ